MKCLAEATSQCETESGQFERGEVAFESTDFLALDIELSAPYTLEWKRGAVFERSWITPDSVCVLPPRSSVHLRWPITINFLTVRLSTSLLAETAAAMELCSPPVFEQLHGQMAPQIAHLGRALNAEERAGSPGGTLLAQSLRTALAVSVFTRFAGVKPLATEAGKNLGRRRFARVREFIEAHLDSDLSLEELASVANLSTYHFARLFKSETGVTPHRYVLNRRIERAAKLLEKGGPPTQVAAQCGFCDQSHLARHLKQRFGLTPRQIEQHREKIAQ